MISTIHSNFREELKLLREVALPYWKGLLRRLDQCYILDKIWFPVCVSHSNTLIWDNFVGSRNIHARCSACFVLRMTKSLMTSMVL
ncbi:unnamed protein product [Coffea canephora]|uniref:DH200=94 genomic scaffold, scaffold_1448 n=1 Tax=Coffea canephora TaxID=49390 RepID=A0A068VJ55_COFCA|nr:unnamed protein product [Coffea canephora]